MTEAFDDAVARRRRGRRCVAKAWRSSTAKAKRRGVIDEVTLMDIIDEVAMVIARRRAKVVRGESVRRDRDVRTFGRSVAGG